MGKAASERQRQAWRRRAVEEFWIWARTQRRTVRRLVRRGEISERAGKMRLHKLGLAA